MEALVDNPPLWWQEGIIYQIYPRSFKDCSGDGVGDLAGVTEKLDYVRHTLGVTAIWLSPFYPSPMTDFGYDVSNYRDVHPLFGDLAAFDALLGRAHQMGLRVIIDLVPNHTSEEHPWFRESRSSRDNPKRDWYIWADAREDGGPPNNWLSVFGGPAWEWDETTRQYYLHSFLKEQPDLNWRNPAVKEAMLDVMRFWLERGVDGFRVDVAHLIMKDPQMRDNPLAPVTEDSTYKPMGEYSSQLHLYDKAHPDVHGVFREMRRVLDEYSREQPRMAVGEIHEFDWPTWAGYYGSQLDELHMPFNFALLHVPWTASGVRQVVDAVEASLPPGAWPNYVLGNHDEHRIATRVGREQERVAMMLLLTLRGTPTVYYGDEIGMHDAPIPPEREQDPWGKREPGLGLGRDPERTPMQWDAGPNAGFCPPSVTPWLPIADDYREINVAKELDDPRSQLTLTRKLIDLRQSGRALSWGSYRPVDVESDACFLFLRESGGSRVLVALNFTDTPQTVSAPDLGPGRIELSTFLDIESPVDLSALELRPHEGCVISLAG